MVKLQTTSVLMFLDVPDSGRLSMKFVSDHFELVVCPVTKTLPTGLSHTNTPVPLHIYSCTFTQTAWMDTTRQEMKLTREKAQQLSVNREERRQSMAEWVFHKGSTKVYSLR